MSTRRLDQETGLRDKFYLSLDARWHARNSTFQNYFRVRVKRDDFEKEVSHRAGPSSTDKKPHLFERYEAKSDRPKVDNDDDETRASNNNEANNAKEE